MIRLMRANSLLIGTLRLSLSTSASSSNLKQELAAQHFSGVLDGDVSFSNLGTIRCGTKPIRVIFYEWYESPPHGEAIHASYRVILMNGTAYLGAYVVGDRPRIEGGILRFPYSANGNSISCGKSGSLPEEVLLDGEIIPLAK